MSRRLTAMGAAAVALMLAAGVPGAQAPAPPAFEVSSVKPNKEGGPSSVRVTPGGLSVGPPKVIESLNGQFSIALEEERMIVSEMIVAWKGNLCLDNPSSA